MSEEQYKQGLAAGEAWARATGATSADRVYSLEAKIIIREIVHDMTTGQVPASVKAFSELHDHVDANEYVLAVMPDYSGSDEDTAVANSLVEEADWWLQHLSDRSSAAAVRKQAPII